MDDLEMLIGMRESEVREWLATHPQFKHRKGREAARDFLERRGRFVDIDPSDDETEQVFPAPAPSEKKQTEPWARGDNGASA